MKLNAIARPYLIFVGGIAEPLGVKTGLGLLEWRPEWCAGQYRFGSTAHDLGLPDMASAAAAAAGVKTMVIGGTYFGGKLAPDWIPAIIAALDAGLDVAAGLHERLNDHPVLKAHARACGRTLHDVRGLPPGFEVSVAIGKPRSGRRVLTVGTDCAVGKKYTALALERDLRRRNIAATFRATGQTGVLISGGGVAIDAVVADFLSGVVERISPANAADHWDCVEGQGSLFHPAYAAVSLGLLHGSQPDAFVVCHDATRQTILGYPDYPVPTLQQCIDLTIACGRLTSPAIQCIGISLNTSGVGNADRASMIAAIEAETGLPCIDPGRADMAAIIDRMMA
jgi:uncharacterized NAD-dependent epimerase/dehydratase family protein